jgi:DeoR family transcriptional regulator of aga operon
MNNEHTTVERRMKIMQMLSEKNQVFVNDLSRIFGVSEVTIRNDLKQLEDKKHLIRARGGAMGINHTVSMDLHLSEKNKLNLSEKSIIGKAAAKLIEDSNTIFIDSGTTTMEIVKNLSPDLKNVTIITNALNIANQLISFPNINLIIPGGVLRKNSLSLIGILAERNLMNFFVDKAFIGVDGFDTMNGISTPILEEAYLDQLIIERAHEVIVVADSTKFLRKSLALICKLDKISTVITDSGISEKDKMRLEEAKIKVILA